ATDAIDAHRQDGVAATLVDFVDRVADEQGGGGGASSNGLWIVLAVVAVIAIVVVFLRRRRTQMQLAAVKEVARDDLTALAEAVQELEQKGEGTAKAKSAYDSALASYQRASESFDRARSPRQMSAVAQAIDDGRYEMAVAEAELAGMTPPERRPPCFFDPRH